MPDITSNITIDITGNTASVATDYGTDGTGFTGSHVSMSKLVWGDTTQTKRVTIVDPLPIQFAGQTGPITISGNVSGTTSSSFPIKNYVHTDDSYFWEGHIGYNEVGRYERTHFVAVSGNTSGLGYGAFIAITGTVQGIENGIPLTMTGDISIRGSLDASRGLAIQGTTCGITATVNGEVYPGYGFGIPIAVTGGRRLHSDVDSVNVSGTINSTGGRQLSPATDSISVYGYDQGKSIHTILRVSNDGGTAGYTSGYPGGPRDTLQVALMNASQGITFSVQLQSVTAVNNDGGTALRIQGATASSNADPVIVRGENDGALEIVATSALNTIISNEVRINDEQLLDYLGRDLSTPIITTLKAIEDNAKQLKSIRKDMADGKVKATIAEISRPGNVRSGTKNVTSQASQLSTNLEMKSGVTIKSSPTSSGNILIGNRSLVNSKDSGYLLEPGESIYLEINNLNKVFVKLNSGTAKIYYIGT